MKSEAKKIDGAAPSAYRSGGLAGRQNTLRAQKDVSASNPGPQNLPLKQQNPNSNLPPATDHGTVPPIWYSFDLAHRRMQEGGSTHQVTERELPSSKEIAGVQMRITAGSYGELHWHIADEWAYMLSGKARVTVLNPNGTMFIDDVEEGGYLAFSRRLIRIRFRASATIAASFCSSSTRATSQRRALSSFPIG
ncbi:MAG: cupin domain-containing protein [Candidatus Korobacteraceae bacterium]